MTKHDQITLLKSQLEDARNYIARGVSHNSSGILERIDEVLGAVK